MSYDVYLNDPVTNEAIHVENAHFMQGGTHAVGGTTELWLNITFNYGKHYYNVIGENGIWTLNGMSGLDSIPILKSAISKLKDDVSEDYWEATEGNAKRPLIQLLAMAQMRPDGIWGVV
jgi:hypothetical protein